MLPFLRPSPYDLAEQDDQRGLPTSNKQATKRGRRRGLLIGGLFAALTLLLLYWQSTKLRTKTPIRPFAEDSYHTPGEIPNIAHFVRQINRHHNGEPKPLRFEFRHFLAYYSAHHYLNPDEINIWSDVDAATIEEAKLHGDVFTKAVLRLPNMRFRYVDMPNSTATGFPIEKYAHKSDFVRTRVMAEMGGQYFDDDSWVIRDLAPFRKAGFENVFGKEWGDDICQAMWMSTSNNPLMRAFERLQETEFNGEWVRASNNLISNLVYDIQGYGHGRYALVLERNAFFPGQWNSEDNGLPMFYKVHNDEGDLRKTLQKDGAPTAATVEDLVSNYRFDRQWGWRKDWRNSYVIHGFSNAIRDTNAWWMFEPYGGFTPKYILSRTSNIARALYPALRHALDSGFLVLDDA